MALGMDAGFVTGEWDVPPRKIMNGKPRPVRRDASGGEEQIRQNQ